MKNLSLYNIEGKEVEKLKLDEKVFDGEVNPAALHYTVVAHLASQRTPCASTKTRSEVRGGGTKPWRQKGTGRARVGSIRSPIFRGGGTTFGPRPHDFSKKVPKKVKRLALRSSLNDKINEKAVIVVEDLAPEGGKTKNLLGILTNLKIVPDKKEAMSILLLAKDKKDGLLRRAARNLKGLTLKDADNFSVYDVIRHRQLLLTRSAWMSLIKKVV